MISISRKAASILAVLGFAAFAGIAEAQMVASPGGGAGQGYGYGMMYGYPGAGPGVMEGWGGGSQGAPWGGRGYSIQNRLDALKTELNITASEADAWNSYASAVTAARKDAWSGMRSIWQSSGNGGWGPDQRFAAMDQMVALMKQGYGQEKKAATALMPHLTPYQQGQAKEILPGLSSWTVGWGPHFMWGGGAAPGFGRSWGLMGRFMGW